MSYLADTYGELRQYKEALAMHRDVLEMLKRVHGSDTMHLDIAREAI